MKYYEDEDARPTTLKGVIDLLDASIEDGSSSDDCSLILKLKDRKITLQAPTSKLAHGWRSAIQEVSSYDCIIIIKAKLHYY